MYQREKQMSQKQTKEFSMLYRVLNTHQKEKNENLRNQKSYPNAKTQDISRKKEQTKQKPEKTKKNHK